MQIRPKPNPRLWRKLRTGAMTRVKTCGAAERPKQRAKNWKTLPNAMTRRKYPEYGCIGKSRYTSFRMLYLAPKSERINIGRHYPQGLVDIKQKAVIAQLEAEPARSSLLEQRLHHLAQGVYPDDEEAKNRHDPASRPNKKRKMDACGRKMSPHAEPPEVRCTHWYHPVPYY